MKIDICVDNLSGHDTSGKLGKINLEVGDKINPGDLLFTIESSKGSAKNKSKYKGEIVEILAKTGDTLKKGEPVMIIEGNSDQVEEEKEKEKGSKNNKYSFGFSKPKKSKLDADVAIIGGGPGGYVAAIRSAQLGKKVVLIEEHKLGGTCLNYGCIPTKALAHSTKVLKHIKSADTFGFNVDSYSIDMKKVIERKSEVVDTLVGGIEHLMESNNIEVVRGTAVVESKEKLIVENKKVNAEITFENLIVATGSEVNYINIEGHDLETVLTSKEALELQKVPESITIIGGGVVGMEFAFIFNALGAKVHVIEYLPEILNLLDQDVVDVIKESAEKKGIKIYSGACASGIYETENEKMLTSYQIEDKTYYISTEKVMMAVGRKPRVDSIDLDLLEVELSDKYKGVKVDKRMQTTNPNVYAIGDVTNIMQLAHVASHQGVVAAENIAGIDSKMHYDLIPSAIFTSPEVGHVGLTEKQAKSDDKDVKISKFDFAANGKSVAMNSLEGFVKIISDPNEEVILGATIVGTNGTDMIATVSNMIKSKTKLEKAVEVIYAHPTASETIHEAILGALDRGLHNA